MLPTLAGSKACRVLCLKVKKELISLPHTLLVEKYVNLNW